MSSQNKFWNYRTLFWLLVFIRAFFNASLPLMDQTEARYAEIARLMVDTQNWIVLQIDYNIPFWAKPPLSTWAAALSILLFGPHSFFVRLHYLLVNVALAFGIPKVFPVQKVPPYLLSIILFTLPEFYLHSGVVSTDVFLNLSIVLVMVSFWKFQKTENKRLWGRLIFLSLGLGLLAKGPIALILTVPPLFIWAIVHKKFIRLLNITPWISGILIMLAVALPWYISAEKNSPGFLDYFIVGEHFSRFFDSSWAGDRYGFPKQQPLGIIWAFLIGATLPWTVIVFHYFKKNARRLVSDKWHFFLLCWLLWTPIVFTFSKSLIHPYTLPVMIPFALFAAEGWKSFAFKKMIFSIAVAIPFLLFGLYICGIGKNVIENSTDKYLVEAATNDPIYAYKKKSYSSQYYTNGTIKTIDSIGYLKLKKKEKPFSILIEKKLVEQIDTTGLYSMKQNKKKLILNFHKQN